MITLRIIIAVFVAEMAFPGPADAGGGGVQEAKTAVDGPVLFDVSVISGDVTIRAGAKKEAKIRVTGTNVPVAFEARGDKRLSVRFGKLDHLRKGDVEVWLPAGSDVAIEAVSGDVTVAKLGGDVRVEAVSGKVAVGDAVDVAVEAVSGGVAIDRAAGNVSVESVSGRVSVATTDRDATKVSVETTSGHVSWTGRCGAGCRIDVESLSGPVELEASAASSFEVDFESFSGNREGPTRVGKGAGKVDVETFSAPLTIRTRK